MTITSRNTPDRMDLRFSGEPIHPILVSFPIAYFTAAFVTDLAYWQTAAVLWETFSDWLITAGLVTTGLAVVAFVIALVLRKPSRALAWPHAVGYAPAVAAECLRSQPRRLHPHGPSPLACF